MSPDNANPPDAFLQVRQAYRLIYAYQRRVRDLLQIIDEHIQGTGFSFKRWRPARSSPPSRSNNPFFSRGKWAWDMLPGYATRCMWTRSDGDGQRRRITVEIHADTGFEWDKEGREPEPGFFKKANKSESELSLILWTYRGEGQPDWIAALNRVRADGHWGSPEGHSVSLGESVYTYACHDVPLHELTGREAVNRLILKRITEWVGRSGEPSRV